MWCVNTTVTLGWLLLPLDTTRSAEAETGERERLAAMAHFLLVQWLRKGEGGEGVGGQGRWVMLFVYLDDQVLQVAAKVGKEGAEGQVEEKLVHQGVVQFEDC